MYRPWQEVFKYKYGFSVSVGYVYEVLSECVIPCIVKWCPEIKWGLSDIEGIFIFTFIYTLRHDYNFFVVAYSFVNVMLKEKKYLF